MNRREFLQSIAAFATTVAIQFDVLATAPESVIDQVWRAVSDDPIIFYVSEYGALSSDAVETYPATRKELLDLVEIGDEYELRELAEDYSSCAWCIESAMEDDEVLDDDGEPVVFNDWHDYLDQADAATIDRLIKDANDWINDTPDEHDYEVANLSGYSGRGYALRYFRDEFEYYEAFNIVVIEGECPGSSYFAAELRMDVDEANVLAKDLDIPIRFAWQG